jgi:hypothetical protein
MRLTVEKLAIASVLTLIPILWLTEKVPLLDFLAPIDSISFLFFMEVFLFAFVCIRRIYNKRA